MKIYLVVARTMTSGTDGFGKGVLEADAREVLVSFLDYGKGKLSILHQPTLVGEEPKSRKKSSTKPSAWPFNQEK